MVHNIQPSEEHSSGGRRVTVKVCNQEKTSRKQIKRCKPFISLKNRKARLDSAKNILKSQSIFFGRMKLTSNKMRRRKKGLEKLIIKAYNIIFKISSGTSGQVDRTVLHRINGQRPKTYCKTQAFVEGKEMYLFMSTRKCHDTEVKSDRS